MTLRKLKTKILSILIVLVMLLCVLPMSVFAEETGGLKPGDTFYFTPDLSRLVNAQEIGVVFLNADCEPLYSTDGGEYFYMTKGDNDIIWSLVIPEGAYEIAAIVEDPSTSYAYSYSLNVILSEAPGIYYNVIADGENWSNTLPVLDILGGTEGTDYTYENGVLDIKAAGTYEIKNANPAIATSDIIKVSAPSGMVNITLSGVLIDVYNSDDKAAFEITGECTTKLILKDGCINEFYSGSNRAGIANHSHNLIITCENAESVTHVCSFNCGELLVNVKNRREIRHDDGAGIGGDANEAGENITITGGYIAAGNIEGNGAGIGGGVNGNGNNITITGGIVDAMSHSGDGISGDNITISGGQVHGSTVFGKGISGNNIKIVPADNTVIHAYNAHNIDGEALDGSPFINETDITEFVNGGGFYCYAEHVHSFSTDWTYDESNHWHAPTCGHDEDISFKMSHSYGTEWKFDGTNHWRECECGAKVDETAHTSDTVTCMHKAVCTVCGEEYGELAEHTYSSEWKSDGTNHWHECSCGAKTEVAGHSGGIATCKDKAVCSTCSTVYGELVAHKYKDGKCTVCEAADPNYVPETDSPQTGDNSHIALWIALLLLSGGTVITLTVVDRKKRAVSKR